MSATKDDIRTALEPYLADTTEGATLSSNLLDVLEDPDPNSEELAESITGALVLYSAGSFSRATLIERLHELLAQLGEAVAVDSLPPQNYTVYFWQEYQTSAPSVTLSSPSAANSSNSSLPVGESNTVARIPFFLTKPAELAAVDQSQHQN